MAITAVSSSSFRIQSNTENSQNTKLSITEGTERLYDLGYGSDFVVLAVVKATDAEFAPYNPWNTGGSMAYANSGSAEKYWVAYRFKNQASDTTTQLRIKSFDASANSSTWSQQDFSSFRAALVEPFFGVDLNGDNLTDGTAGKTKATSDTAGTELYIDQDGATFVKDGAVEYAVAPRMGGSYSLNTSYGSFTRQVVAVEKVASTSGSSEPEFLMVVKSTGQGSGSSSSASNVSWEVYTLRTQQGWAQQSAQSATGGTIGSSGTTMPPSTPPGNSTPQSSVPTLYFDWEAARPSSISSYEVAGKLNQNLDDDPAIGIPLQSLVAVSNKTTGLRLERDSQGAIYIVEGSGNSKTAKAVDNISSAQYNYTWGENNSSFNRASIKEIAAVTQGNQVVGYKLAVKKESSYSMYSGTSSGSGGNNSSTVYTTWDVLYVDAQNPKINWGGQWDSRQNKWINNNETNLRSIADHEVFFNADLNGDGSIGVNVSSLTVLNSDTAGVKLARATDQSLYVVAANGNSAKLVKADWLESSYRMDDNNYNRREAIAIETIESSATITGYRLLMKSSNKWGSQPEQVSYDIMRLDADAKIVYGEMRDGTWVSYSTYGIKSLAAYEDEFNQDLNNDGYRGVNPATLERVATDTVGIRLAKDASGGFYLLDETTNPISVKVIKDAPSLEWSYGNTDSRVAVGAEAVRSGDTLTGYKVAVKQTRYDYYNQRSETTWEIVNLDATGKATYGMGAMASGGQLKSIAPYETDFDQDMNNDGRIGVDTSTLQFGASDTVGERLAKDGDGALYIVSTTNSVTKTIPVGNSSWMEYRNTWTDGYNIREAVAVTADKSSAGAVLGYKLVLRNTNAWSGSTGEQKTFDILYLSTSGFQQYGSMVNNVWVDKNVYGAKSLVPYETQFGQDFNGDNVVGIDINRLTEVPTDRRGVRLRRDNENALYLIDEAPGSSPKAMGNASWLEYTNSWGSGSNSRVAVGIGSTQDGQGNLSGYTLALKTTNTWDNNTTVNWEILSLDSEAKVSWGMAASGTGGSVWTNNIRPFETMVGEDLDGDGNVGIDRSALTTLDTETGSTDTVKLAKDSNGLVYILDGNTTTLALRDNYGATPMLEFSRSWTGGSSNAALYAVGKDSAGNYKIAVKQTQVNGSTIQVSWQIHTASSEGVLNWSQMATVKSPARFETVIGQDLDGDGQIGQVSLQLSAVSTDNSSTDSFQLKKDSLGQLFIYDRLDADNNNLTYIVDARGGSPSFDVSFSGYTAQAHAVHKQADGTYRLAVKKTTSTSAGDVVKWDVYSISARDGATDTATIDWSRTAFSLEPLEVERLINQDVNNDGVVASARLAPAAALSSDTASTVTLGRDLENYVWIKDGTTWKEVKDLYGTGVKLDSSESLPDGGLFATETVAATTLTADGVSSYRIAVKESLTLTANATPSVQWKIYTVSNDGTIDLNPVVTNTISAWESNARFSQDLDGVTAVIGAHASGDAELAADQLGGIYLVRGENKLIITDGNDGTPELEYKQSFEGGSVVAKIVGATDDDSTNSAVGDKLLALEVTTTLDNDSSSYWIVHSARYNDADTPTNSADDYYTIDWGAAVITTNMSDYTDVFGQAFSQPAAATLGA